MLSNKKISEIEFLTLKFVSSMFATFHNSNYRGEKFSWENFPKIMEETIESQILISVKFNNKNKNEIIELAKTLAFHESINLINKMLK